jgi:hypothetical protein
MGDHPAGLYDKYTVLQDGGEQNGCFILEPESDPAALEALRTYANETDNTELRSDLRGWIMAIEEQCADSEVGQID